MTITSYLDGIKAEFAELEAAYTKTTTYINGEPIMTRKEFNKVHKSIMDKLVAVGRAASQERVNISSV